MTTSVLQFIIQNTTVTKVLREGMKTITEASKLLTEMFKSYRELASLGQLALPVSHGVVL